MPIEDLNQHPKYATVSELIPALERKGYTYDFKLDTDCITYENGKQRLNADQFEIDHVYRFEGMSDPSDEAVVYSISVVDSDIKGYLIDAFGVYGDTLSAKMIAKLRTHPEP